MFDIVKTIHEALRTDSTWAFVLIVSIIFGVGSGSAAWLVDKAYKNSPEYRTEHATLPDLKVFWNSPAPIVEGTPLSGIQLNAMATVEGVFVYAPPLGTVLPLGRNRLEATFYPKDSSAYHIYVESSGIEVTKIHNGGGHEPPIPQPAGLDDKPEISARFIQATSPGVVLFNRSKVVVRDPTCALQMWNLSKTPPITFPTFDAPQTNRFIKPGTGLVAASFDNPTMKPLLSDGDRIFGYVTVDCPDCENAHFYWLYSVYNRPTESWYSEIPIGTPINVFAIGRLLEQSKWDIGVFMSQIPHGPKLPAENGFDLKPQ